MDKQTLSNYGWIVICILVLCVMIALATPFGSFIASGVKSTTQGLFDVNQKAFNNVGFGQIADQEFENNASPVEMISFIFLGEEFPVEKGMTWGEFVKSKYNTSTFGIADDSYFGDGVNYNNAGSTWVKKVDGDYVVLTDEIIDGCEYTVGGP